MLQEVPGHILDMIPVLADKYIAKQKDRLLSGIPEDQHDAILERSTHHLTRTEDRRALHQSIILQLAKNIDPDATDQRPTYLSFFGPPASGKSTLRGFFDSIIAYERPTTKAPKFKDKQLGLAYAAYKNAKQHFMASDFDLLKQRLPEFENTPGFEKQFAIIRAEAAAINQAASAWAAELNANIIEEQIGDADLEGWVRTQQETHDVVAIGMTTDPALNLDRLDAREAQTGQHIEREQVTGAIQRFSADNAFIALARNAQQAFLVQSGDRTSKVILAAQNGQMTYHDRPALTQFIGYAETQTPTTLKQAKPTAPR